MCIHVYKKEITLLYLINHILDEIKCLLKTFYSNCLILGDVGYQVSIYYNTIPASHKILPT